MSFGKSTMMKSRTLQDSLTGQKFKTIHGNTLTITGYIEHRRPDGKRSKKYEVICNKKNCLEELFYITKGNLNAGKTPCKCSHSYRQEELGFCNITERFQDSLNTQKYITKYGNELTVIGYKWHYKPSGKRTKKYQVTCNQQCCQAVVFSSAKSDLNAGKSPCKCSPSYKFKDTGSCPITNLKTDEFCGASIPHGNGIYNVLSYKKVGNKDKLYILECSTCSEDKELWPTGTIKIKKGNLERGYIPCGCSKAPKWTEEQYKIRVKRECDNIGFAFLGWYGIFNGCDTYLDLYNPISFNRWLTTKIDNLFQGVRDPCLRSINGTNKTRIPKKVRESQIKNILSKENSVWIGWGEEYSNNESRFWWKCPKGCITLSAIRGFIDSSTRCNCNSSVPNPDEPDFLYVIRFKNENIIKIGRSLQREIRNRHKTIRKESGKSFHLLFLKAATYKFIFAFELQLHKILKPWKAKMDGYNSREIFSVDCLPMLEELITVNYNEDPLYKGIENDNLEHLIEKYLDNKLFIE